MATRRFLSTILAAATTAVVAAVGYAQDAAPPEAATSALEAAASSAAPKAAAPAKSLRRPSRANIHHWERHVRGFRREHNFALTLGGTSGQWNVKHLGSIEGERYARSGFYGRFQYGFHLPFTGSFGYILGSALGYHYESSDRQSQFKVVPATIFPGVLVGLVYDLSPVFRIGATLDSSLERFEGLADRGGAEGETEIFVTMQAFDAAIFWDLFYDLAWAVRLEFHRREVEYARPGEAAGYPVDANLRKSESWGGLGLVYHLL